ncbi:MAG TPA: sulfotransferase domain-containing protein [Candidatus Dormibacteraeota bacterium]|nr:sulfotransferase domain-containing protein [Candidatus Dormibacteraeota bacterium]
MQPSDGTLKRTMRVIGQLGRVLTGRQVAGRNLTVFPDDVFLVSYPRSGNTWARFLIASLIFENDPSFINVESRIPEIYFNPDHRMRRLPRPRILKSHECFQPHYRRIIYIARDPRDVAVSFYHHNVKAGNIPDNYPMEDYIPRFMNVEFDTKWGSWADHVQSWMLLRQNHPDFLFLRYEDMKRDTMSELERIAGFLRERSFRIDESPEKLKRAIELSSPERMRALEKQQSADWVLTKSTRPDKPFVRTATAGGWKSVLSPASVASIQAAWGKVMTTLGYDLEDGVAGSTASSNPGESTRTSR